MMLTSFLVNDPYDEDFSAFFFVLRFFSLFCVSNILLTYAWYFEGMLDGEVDTHCSLNHKRTFVCFQIEESEDEDEKMRKKSIQMEVDPNIKHTLIHYSTVKVLYVTYDVH